MHCITMALLEAFTCPNCTYQAKKKYQEAWRIPLSFVELLKKKG